MDLDNTSWGGTIGDLGWKKKIVLGGHDYLGEGISRFSAEN